MADALISSITSELTSIISSRIQQEYRLVVGVTKEIEKRRSNFITIQAVLEDAERRQIKDSGVRQWLDELKQVCYDMEDVLADWRIAIHEWEIKEAHAKAAAADKSKFFAGCCSPLNRCFNQVKRRRDIAQRIKDICERLDQIDKERSSYGFTVYSAPAEEHERPITSKSRVTTSHVDAPKMRGRVDDKKNLINKLLCTVEKSTREVPVVAIVGQGGIGKTTLAQLAYNDEEVKAHFEKRVWICVSEPFDKINIARGIVRALNNSSTDVNSLELDLLLNKISELVNKKRFLLVLDDVWNEDRAEWERLKLSFERGDPQSRILVTTRKDNVAKVMGTTYFLPIGLLFDNECWLVFRELAFSGRSEDECKNLEDIGWNIVVKKVKGLPLAANILGGLMQFKKSKEEWENVLSSNLWKVEGVESKLFGPLLLSYYDLPASMRRCFTYFAMFPKDTTMLKSDIIRMWMAQGYLNKATSSKEMKLLGEEYFDNLVVRSFFQNLEKSYSNVVKFKMHDIVHDSAQILSGNECFSCTGKEIRTESCFNERVRHLSLLSPSREDLESVCSAKSLRSLYIEDHSQTIVEALPKLLRSLKYLRALYFRSRSIKEIPSEVKDLKHLRYLSLVPSRVPQNSTILISPIISELTSIIRSWVKEEYKLVVGVKEEIIKLKNYFTNIQDVLMDAQWREIKDVCVRDWLDDLKQVCYDMEDVLADWSTEYHEWEIKEADAKAAAADKSKFFAGCCSPLNRCFNQVKRRRDIAQRIKDICERLDQIDKKKSSYGFTVYSAPAEEHERPITSKSRVTTSHVDAPKMSGRGPITSKSRVTTSHVDAPKMSGRGPITSKSRVTTSHVDAPKMSGRDDDKKNLINKLLCTVENGTREIPVVAIVGQGGFGKTTLAQLAYNDEEVKAHFQKRVWICVSESFDKVNIARGIIRALDNSSTDVNSLELDLLLNKISELVNEKLFLLVLDDVWNEDHAEWEALKPSFEREDPQSRILVTTRKKKVAKVMGTTYELERYWSYVIGLLSYDECWFVFRQLAFSGRSEDECKNLKDIGRKIVVEKVKGLPLAANILGGLMQFKKRKWEWEDVLSSELWEVEGVECKLFGPLLLSYYDLPAAMRRCFTYCAMFPKDTTMLKSDMIRMWMAQGYLNKATSSKELVGEEYFNNLVVRSFFQNVKKSERHFDDIEFKMHDIVHDSAQILSGNECFSCTGKEIRTESCFNERVRHLSLLSPSREDLESVCSAKSLRSLYIEDDSQTIVEALPKLLRNLKYLRALYLRSSSIKEIPSEVKELKHLRYLNLGKCDSIEVLVAEIISKLWRLEILYLYCKNETSLVGTGIEKLINLRHLWISEDMFLPKGIGRLTSLRTLNFFRVGYETRGTAMLRELQDMNQLEGILCISRLGKVVDVDEAVNAYLKNKKRLTGLVLCFEGPEDELINNQYAVLEALEGPSGLEYLRIYNYKGALLPNWIISLSNLTNLWLRDCETLTVDLVALARLPSLEILRLVSVNIRKYNMEDEEEEEGGTSSMVARFLKLKELELGNIKELEESVFAAAEMPQLRKFGISKCPKMKNLPDCILTAPQLQELAIYDCPILKEHYNEESGKYWDKISHIPKVYILE